MNSPLLELLLDPLTVSRLLDLENDPSAQGRYVGNAALQLDWYTFFGHGISTQAFQAFMGANGLSFYIYSFGIFGFLLFLAWILVDSKADAVRKAFLIGFAMSTYPLFTYFIWWAWLAILVIGIGRQHGNNRRIAETTRGNAHGHMHEPANLMS